MKDQDYIYAIYEEKSFSAAARKLFISQPALSMTVKRVEESLGITIFDRSSTPLTLTDEGKVYIESIEGIRSIERTMKNRLEDMADLRSGRVIVSGENFVTSFILPEVLMEFSKKYNGINVELVESNSPDLRQQLLSESIDLLVAHDFDPQFYTAEELFSEDMLLAVPENLEINNGLKEYALTCEDIRNEKHKVKKPVDLALFSDEEFLVLKPGNDSYRRVTQLCAAAGFQPKVRINLDQLITAYNLACAGMGVTFTSDVLVKKAAAKGCIYYCLEGEFAKRKMFIGYKKNRYLNRSATAFIDTAKEVFSK